MEEIQYVEPGVPEVVRDGETGLLAREHDVAAFADALARMINNPRLAAELGANARLFVLTQRSLKTARDILAKTLPDLLR